MLLALPLVYGGFSLWGLEVSFNTRLQYEHFSAQRKVPDGDVKTGSCQVSPPPRWAALALRARGGPKVLVGSVCYGGSPTWESTGPGGDADLSPAPSHPQRGPWGSTAPRQDASWQGQSMTLCCSIKGASSSWVKLSHAQRSCKSS